MDFGVFYNYKELLKKDGKIYFLISGIIYEEPAKVDYKPFFFVVNVDENYEEKDIQKETNKIFGYINSFKFCNKFQKVCDKSIEDYESRTGNKI